MGVERTSRKSPVRGVMVVRFYVSYMYILSPETFLSSVLNSVLIHLLIYDFPGAVSAVTTHNQNGCHNSDVILACPQYTKNKPGTLEWRFKDKTTGRWSQVASIRNSQTKLSATNTALDGRSAIHPNGSLEIHSLRPDDETMYQCIVKQGSRKLHVINLNVSCGKYVQLTWYRRGKIWMLMLLKNDFIL